MTQREDDFLPGSLRGECVVPIRMDRNKESGVKSANRLSSLCRPNLSQSCFALVSGPGSLPGNGRYGMEEGQLLRCHAISMNSRFACGKREASPKELGTGLGLRAADPCIPPSFGSTSDCFDNTPVRALALCPAGTSGSAAQFSAGGERLPRAQLRCPQNGRLFRPPNHELGKGWIESLKSGAPFSHCLARGRPPPSRVPSPKSTWTDAEVPTQQSLTADSDRSRGGARKP